VGDDEVGEMYVVKYTHVLELFHPRQVSDDRVRETRMWVMMKLVKCML